MKDTKYIVKTTTQFKNDFKLAKKRGLKMELLREVIPGRRMENPSVRCFCGMTGMPFVCGESPQGAQLPANPIATCKVRIVRCGREEAIAKS